MAAVSNTSPISNLAIIGRLDLLRSQFGALIIPSAVLTELDALQDEGARHAIKQALRVGWMQHRTLSDSRLAVALTHELDLGEAEAIALASELSPEVLLIDERDGRLLAREIGIPVIGVLGVLLRAKANSEIASVREEMAALVHRAGFFIDLGLRSEILFLAGESTQI